MKRILVSVGAFVLGLVLFLFIISQVGLSQVIQQYEQTDHRHLILYIMISVSIIAVLILKWEMILRAMGHKISFLNLLLYRQMSYSIGYVVPSFYIGGETIRALSLTRHNVPTSKAIASVFLDRAVELPFYFLLACIMFFFTLTRFAVPKSVMIILGVASLYLIFICLNFYYRMFNKQYVLSRHPLLRLFSKTKRVRTLQRKIRIVERNLIRFFNNNRKTFFFSLMLTSLLWALMIAEYKMGLLVVGYRATIIQIYLIVTMTGIAMMIPVPAVLGVMELSQVAVATLVGIPVQVAVALSLLIRARDILWVLSGILAYLYHGTSYMKDLVIDLRNNKNGHS
ncbi:flippase-like domain-containing protein [Candidatus Woesearchaeota archaeon]|nr:flippase-like domain-containing protein [Candidatus Woesearchaeota archaeon]